MSSLPAGLRFTIARPDHHLLRPGRHRQPLRLPPPPRNTLILGIQPNTSISASPAVVSTNVRPSAKRISTSMFHIRSRFVAAHGSITATLGNSCTVIRPVAGS